MMLSSFRRSASGCAAFAFSLSLAGAALLAGPAAAQQASLDGAVFQDWRVRCSEPTTGSDGQSQPSICEAYQLVVQEEQQKPVLEVVIAYPPNQENPVGAIIVPLGVLLPAGISVTIDGKELGRLPFQRCVPKGCVGQFVFTPEQFKSWRAGSKATVTVANGTGKEIQIPLSLLGFTDATTAVKQP